MIRRILFHSRLREVRCHLHIAPQKSSSEFVGHEGRGSCLGDHARKADNQEFICRNATVSRSMTERR